MPFIERISIQHLRNLTDIALEFSPSLNIILGKNGSGKTSLLEAISLLSLGRSFRSHKSRNIIQCGHDELTVFGQLNSQFNRQIGLGIQKNRRGFTSLKIDGAKVHSCSFLAKNLPLQIMHSQSFQLLEGASRQRRQFLDWMVFHVKPDFIGVWNALQKILKHRNSILRRDRINLEELIPWNKEFFRLAKIVDCLRNEVFQEFKSTLMSLLPEFIAQHPNLKINYYCGWNSDKSLEDVLSESFNRDFQNGYTQYGPHRADLKN